MTDTLKRYYVQIIGSTAVDDTSVFYTGTVLLNADDYVTLDRWLYYMPSALVSYVLEPVEDTHAFSVRDIVEHVEDQLDTEDDVAACQKAFADAQKR